MYLTSVQSLVTAYISSLWSSILKYSGSFNLSSRVVLPLMQLIIRVPHFSFFELRTHVSSSKLVRILENQRVFFLLGKFISFGYFWQILNSVFPLLSSYIIKYSCWRLMSHLLWKYTSFYHCTSSIIESKFFSVKFIFFEFGFL